MRNKSIKKLLDEVPIDVKLFVDKYCQLRIKINEIIVNKGLDIDVLPHTKCFLDGETEETLRIICSIEIELGETLIEITQ